MTRRFLDEHPFLSKTGVVQVFSKVEAEGELKLATRQVAVSQSFWTTIGIVYDILRQLGWDLDGTMHKASQRATDEVLDASYDRLADRVDRLLDAAGDLNTKFLSAVSGAQLRAPKGKEYEGHPFMRPVVQLAVARAVRHVVEQGLLTWDEALAKLKTLTWRMDAPPFVAVWVSTPDRKSKGRMLTGKDDQALLFNLLVAHLAPSTKAQITRVLADFKARRGTKYPVDANALNQGLVAAEAPSDNVPAPENPLTEKPREESLDVLEDAPVEYVPEDQEGARRRSTRRKAATTRLRHEPPRPLGNTAEQGCTVPLEVSIAVGAPRGCMPTAIAGEIESSLIARQDQPRRGPARRPQPVHRRPRLAPPHGASDPVHARRPSLQRGAAGRRVRPGRVLLGEIGDGWRQVTGELAYERSGPDRYPSTYLVLAELLLSGMVGTTTGSAAQVGRLTARLWGLRQMSLSIARALDGGAAPRVEAAAAKDLGTAFENEVIDVVRQCADVEPDPTAGSVFLRLLAEAVVTAPTFTIRGGTSEILRSIITRELVAR